MLGLWSDMKNADPHTSPKNLQNKSAHEKNTFQEAMTITISSTNSVGQLTAMCRVNFHQMRWNLRWNLWGLPSCNSQVKHLQKEKVEPSIWKEKKLTEFASNTCSAIQGSRPHQNTTSLLPCVASTSIRCVGTYVGTCGAYHLAIPKWNICKKKRLSLPFEKKRSWQNLHRTDALQFKALGLIRILPACCHVSRQLPSDALELALELVGSTILQFPSETSAKRKGWAFHLKRKEVDRICIEQMLCNSRL